MSKRCLATRLVWIGLVAACNTFVCASAVAQTSTTSSDSITVNLSLDKKQVAIGQSPYAILTLKNLSDHEIPIHAWMYRVRVDGENGEAPTTYVQRAITGKLRPGEPGLRADENYIWTIPPGESSVHKFQLTYLYDLSVPGKYTAYLEVMDPSTLKSSEPKWLRTNVAQFTMQAPDP
jgi:hypothetical protein